MLHPIENASLHRAAVKKLAADSGALPRHIEGLIAWIQREHKLTPHGALKLAAEAIAVVRQRARASELFK